MMICSKTNGPISFLYFGVTIANIYFSFFAKIGYLYTLGMIALQVLVVFFFLYQAWSGGDKAQEKLKDYVIGRGQQAASHALTKGGNSQFKDQMI